jgi:ATP-dependent DNA helicase RecQ
LAYFGEKAKSDCGICSYCITKTKIKKNDTVLSENIIELLQKGELNSREIQTKTKVSSEEVIFAVQELLEKEIIIIQENNKYTLK